MRDPFPDVSVIIPTYRRPLALAACLDALATQDYPTDRFEVVVVDDGGELRDPAPRAGPLRLRLLRQPNAGPASARNAGAAVADGVILAFTDDDCRPATDWLRRVTEPVRNDARTLSGGRTLNALTDNSWSTASQLLVDYLYEAFGSDRDGTPTFFTSNNMAMAAESFREIGGFDASFRRAAGEDRDLCDHWVHAGGRLEYVPGAIVHHYHDLGPRAFWRQHFAYGGGAYRFHRARARRGQQPVRVEPLSFYLRLLTYPARRGVGLRTPQQMALMMISQIANVAGYFAERSRTPDVDAAD